MEKLDELMKDVISDINDIEDVLYETDDKDELIRITERYPVKVTPYYLSLIDRDDPNDPIKKMCIPTSFEYSEGGVEDTSGESENTVIRGMQHKYRETVLILATNQCAAYCRHCFRKRMVGHSSDEVAALIPEMGEYIRSHKEINNVLITGGDAFVMPDDVIERYLKCFSAIDNIKLIRFGTRVPVVLPRRITSDNRLLQLLSEYGRKKQIAVVTQFNHIRELTGEAREAVRALCEAGCYVRNQTVMLKGVNDDPEVLAELMNGLVSNGVIPYYIFQCRPVLGVLNQFQVPIMKSLAIIDEARSMMNGQAKSFHYVMSHPTGKIEIIGLDDEGYMIFKYHQAREEKDRNRIFRMKLAPDTSWLDI